MARRWILARSCSWIGLIVISSVVGWWLFGWTTEDNPALGVFRHQRFFGRTVYLYLDSNRNGAFDAKVSFTWLDPYQGNVCGYCVWHGRVTEDRNHDGRWDTWVQNLGPADTGDCLTEFKVDMTGDGQPDWQFHTTNSIQAYEDITARRGF